MRFVKLFIAGAIGAASLAAAAPRPASDIPADPAVRAGVLPNGLHYEILRNATPPHTAALRLRIDAGSLNEKDDERGIAHFVEHMVMSGTKNVAEGEMVKRLERAGLRFGPDTNAFTDFRQTYYALNLPETDPPTLDTALTLLREVAGEAVFPAATVERQRGIILAEERSRSNVNLRASQEELRFLMRGDVVAERMAIGQPEIVRTVPREWLVRFYDAYYRPERATLIAVGDFAPDRMEAEIKRLFGTWHGRGPAGAAPPPPILPERAPEGHVFVDPAAPERVTLAWLAPADRRPDTRAVRADRLLTTVAVAILNRRVGRINTAGPLVATLAQRVSFSRRAEAVLISGIAKPGQWKAALQRLAQEQRLVAGSNIGQAEVDREVTALRTALQASAAAAPTRDTTTLAQQLLSAAADERVFTSPAEGLAEFEADVGGLTPERVTAALRRLFATGGPLVYLTSPAAIEGGDTAVAAAYQEAARGPLVLHPESLPIPPPKGPWPYSDFGRAGAVIERRELPDVGATAVRFQNGVRLTVKKTGFAKDEVLVSVAVGHGRLGLSADEVPAAFALGTGGLIQGGLGKAGVEAIREQLAARVYGLAFSVADDAFLFRGRTRPADLDVQLQLFAAYVSDAALRAGAWARIRGTAGTLHDQLAGSPGGVFTRDAQRLLHGGDPRWGVPSRERIVATTPADTRGIVAAMRLAPIEVIVVGDVDVEAVIKAVAATFGALPPRTNAPLPPGRSQVHFPAPGLVRAYHKGRADQGLAFIAWPTTDLYSDEKRARTLNLLGQVFRLRLLDEIREKLGVSYSPSAGHNPSEEIPGYGYLSALVEAPPEKMEAVLEAASRIAAGLREQPVSADELQRARRPLIENILRERAGNAYWLNRLGEAQTRPEVVQTIGRAIPDYEAVTPTDLQQAARIYLQDAKAWKMEIVPEPKP